jgi:hypothetical protein
MLFEERYPAGKCPEPVLGRIDPQPESLILGLELDHPLSGLRQLGPGEDATIGPGLL